MTYRSEMWSFTMGLNRKLKAAQRAMEKSMLRVSLPDRLEMKRSAEEPKLMISLLEECNIAKICRHDQVPICGIDSCGEMRTFIDTCDMHEFNCDNEKDFSQKPAHECWVTCKRGRSFKKPLYDPNCFINTPNKIV